MNREWLNHSVVGYKALNSCTTGHQNMAIGYRAGHNIPRMGNSRLGGIALKPTSDSVITIAKNRVDSAIEAVRSAARSTHQRF